METGTSGLPAGAGVGVGWRWLQSMFYVIAGWAGAVAVFSLFEWSGPAGAIASSRVVVTSNMIRWGGWALLTPVIIVLLQRSERWPAIVRHVSLLPFGVAISGAQGVLFALGSRAIMTVPAVVGRVRTTGVLESASLSQRVEAGLGLNLITFGLIVGAVRATMYYRDLQRRRAHEGALTARLAEAELQILRMRLHPHFFFNTLNTISALMGTDVPAARRVVASLGDLLRFSIDSARQPVISLREELSFVTRYLDIQCARFDRLSVAIEVSDETLDLPVPTLLLQPLAENAVRHGIEPFPEAGAVRISARRADDTLELSVHNGSPSTTGAIPPLFGVASGRPAGLGLTNTAERLTQLYGPAHELRAGPVGPGSYRVLMRLPARVPRQARGSLEIR